MGFIAWLFFSFFLFPVQVQILYYVLHVFLITFAVHLMVLSSIDYRMIRIWQDLGKNPALADSGWTWEADDWGILPNSAPTSGGQPSHRQAEQARATPFRDSGKHTRTRSTTFDSEPRSLDGWITTRHLHLARALQERAGDGFRNWKPLHSEWQSESKGKLCVRLGQFWRHKAIRNYVIYLHHMYKFLSHTSYKTYFISHLMYL